MLWLRNNKAVNSLANKWSCERRRLESSFEDWINTECFDKERNSTIGLFG